MTLRPWREQSVYPNKRIIKINNQSFQKGRVPRKPRQRQNLCSQLSLDWLFYPACRVINPTCFHLTLENRLSPAILTAKLDYVSL